MAENITPAQVPEVEEVTQILGFDAVNKWAKMPGTKITQAVTAANDAVIVANDAKTVADNAMPKRGGTFTGAIYAPTPDVPKPSPIYPVPTGSTRVATTAFVMDALSQSPVLGGTPTAPTPVDSNNSTTIATTAFVKNQLKPYRIGAEAIVSDNNDATFDWYIDGCIFYSMLYSGKSASYYLLDASNSQFCKKYVAGSMSCCVRIQYQSIVEIDVKTSSDNTYQTVIAGLSSDKEYIADVTLVRFILENTPFFRHWITIREITESAF